MKFFLLLILHTVVSSQAAVPDITFNCNASGQITLGTLQMDNNPINITKLTIENSDKTQCNPKDKSLSGCQKMVHSIKLRYQDDTKGNVVGGKDYYLFELTCKDTGEYKASPLNLQIIEEGSTIHPLTAKQSHHITLSLLEHGTTTKAHTAYLGQELTLKMEINEEDYSLSPIECTATPKDTTTGVQPYSFWKRDGECTRDESIVGQKWTASDNKQNSVSIDMYAFRFPSSKGVTIECNVQVCKSGCSLDCIHVTTTASTTTAPTTTASPKTAPPIQKSDSVLQQNRRRRSIVSKSKTYVRNASVSFNVIDEYSNSGDHGMQMNKSLYILAFLIPMALLQRWMSL